MMKTPVASLNEARPALNEARPNQPYTVNTKAGTLPCLNLRAQPPVAPSISPSSRAHFKNLPDSVTAIPADDTQAILDFVSAEHSLVVDIRPFNMFSSSRLHNAFNICIPTTLLKRPNYDLQHIINTSALPADRRDLVNSHAHSMNVLVYDAQSSSSSVSFLIYQTIQKFLKYDCFNVAFLDGGFQRVPDQLVESCPPQHLASSMAPAAPLNGLRKPDLKISPPSSNGESSPFLCGFTLPSATASKEKMLMSIKKNLPKLDTTISYHYNLRLPPDFEHKKEQLPEWLSFFARDHTAESYNTDVINVLTEKFNNLEKTEQARLSMAISNSKRDTPVESPSAGGCKDPFDSASFLHPGKHSDEGCSPSSLCPCCDKINYKIPKGIEYGYKNRYNNIWPYEHSRVRLISSPSCPTPKKENNDDYFNANYISFPKLSSTRYIATQNPLEATKEDFWNTVWYNGVKCIICLNKPSFFTPRAYYEEDTFFEKSKLNVKIISREHTSAFGVREVCLSKHGNRRTVYHLAYHDWPDFGVPDNFDSVMQLIDKKNECLQTLAGQTPPTAKISQPWDLLVHCSAGCGRTGCFITLDMVRECFHKHTEKQYDPWAGQDLIFKAVQFQRQQRIAMVQNLDQFIYCYENILTYIAEHLIGQPNKV